MNTHMWTYLIGIIPIVGPIFAKKILICKPEGLQAIKDQFSRYYTQQMVLNNWRLQ